MNFPCKMFLSGLVGFSASAFAHAQSQTDLQLHCVSRVDATPYYILQVQVPEPDRFLLHLKEMKAFGEPIAAITELNGRGLINDERLFIFFDDKLKGYINGPRTGEGQLVLSGVSSPLSCK